MNNHLMNTWSSHPIVIIQYRIYIFSNDQVLISKGVMALKKKMTVCIIYIFAVTTIILQLTACWQPSTVTKSTTSTETPSTFYGKVTAVDGTKITLALGTLFQPGGQFSGQKPDSRPSGTIPDGSRPQGSLPSGETRPDRSFEMLTLTGESKTIVVDDVSILTKMDMSRTGFPGFLPDSKNEPNTTAGTTSSENIPSVSEEAATLADITIGSILIVTLDAESGKLTSVQIISFGLQPGDT
jgi:hypothetical protein